MLLFILKIGLKVEKDGYIPIFDCFIKKKIEKIFYG